MHKLTGKEKLVLYSLVRWPTLNDIELSKKIPIKRPTITAIRNKLRKEGIYRDIIVPNLEMLGCEILTVRYGGFNPTTTYEDRKKYSSVNRFPEVFFKKSCDSQRIALSAAKNFTEVMEYIEYSNIIYDKHNLLGESGLKHVLFPLKLSKILRFFDYAPLLRKELEIDVEEKEVKQDLKPRVTKPRDFTENEKIILYALTKYPELNDGEIAKKISMTRQSVNKMKKKFEMEGMIRKIRVPDIKKLGFEVIVLVHFFIKPEHVMEEREASIEYTLGYPNIVFLVSRNLESAVVGVAKTFTELKKAYTTFLSEYKRRDLMAKEPVMVIMPVEEIKDGMDGRYHPLVKKVLGIKKEV